MSDARYFLPDHSSLKDTYAKEDLRRLVKAGRLSRSEIALDDVTGLAHLLGDLLAAPYHGTTPPGRRAILPEAGASDVEEFRAATPLPRPESRAPHDAADETFFDDEPEDFEDNSGNDDDELDAAGQFSESPPVPLPQTGEGVPAEDEEFHYHGRPSWFSYPKSLLAIAAFSTAALLCYQHAVGVVWTATWASLAALTMLLVMLKRTTTEYFVTSRRVEMESGSIGRNTKEIRISDIRAIDVTQAGWNAFMGVGTVEFFSSADEADVVFANIWRPHRVKELVRELQG